MQMLWILDFNAKILRKEIIERVTDIISQDQEYIYKSWIFIPRK